MPIESWPKLSLSCDSRHTVGREAEKETDQKESESETILTLVIHRNRNTVSFDCSEERDDQKDGADKPEWKRKNRQKGVHSFLLCYTLHYRRFVVSVKR